MYAEVCGCKKMPNHTCVGIRKVQAYNVAHELSLYEWKDSTFPLPSCN